MDQYKIERSLLVDAPISAIWKDLLDVHSWPAWKPFIKGTEFAGDVLESGSKFKMKIAVKGPAVPISLTVCGFEEPTHLAWTGGLPGMVISLHSFLMEAQGDKTLVISREEFSGALVWLMKIFVTEKDLFSLHDRWLDSIKKRLKKQ